jgi:hypothetical protein
MLRQSSRMSRLHRVRRNHNFSKAVELYDHVLKVLRWAPEEYIGVPMEQHGLVLEDTFVNGVRKLRLTAYMRYAFFLMTSRLKCVTVLEQAYSDNENKRSKKFTLKALLKKVDSLIEDVRTHPPSPSEPGFNLVFGNNIEANAFSLVFPAACVRRRWSLSNALDYFLSMKGYYWNHLARASKFKTAEDIKRSLARFQKSADFY